MSFLVSVSAFESSGYILPLRNIKINIFKSKIFLKINLPHSNKTVYTIVDIQLFMYVYFVKNFPFSKRTDSLIGWVVYDGEEDKKLDWLFMYLLFCVFFQNRIGSRERDDL